MAKHEWEEWLKEENRQRLMAREAIEGLDLE